MRLVQIRTIKVFFVIHIYIMCTRRPEYGLKNTAKHNYYDTRDCVIAKCRNYQSVTVRRGIYIYVILSTGIFTYMIL